MPKIQLKHKSERYSEHIPFIIKCGKDKYSMYGSVQVLWYELADDKDAIKEFREINTGKIYLTDAELIKALFLRTQNLESQEHIQMQRALEWEILKIRSKMMLSGVF